MEQQAAALNELRALRRRLELNQLDTSDWPKVRELLAREIEEAEAAGLEEVVIGPDRDPQR